MARAKAERRAAPPLPTGASGAASERGRDKKASAETPFTEEKTVMEAVNRRPWVQLDDNGKRPSQDKGSSTGLTRNGEEAEAPCVTRAIRPAEIPGVRGGDPAGRRHTPSETASGPPSSGEILSVSYERNA